MPEGLEDVSKYANLFSSLYGSGNWTLVDLKKLAGLNFLRVWREVEKVKLFSFEFASRENIHSVQRWAEASVGLPMRREYLRKRTR